jgi:hypothetical protein
MASGTLCAGAEGIYAKDRTHASLDIPWVFVKPIGCLAFELRLESNVILKKGNLLWMH